MRRSIFLLLIVLIIATFFRLYQLQSAPPGLYPDEAMNGNNALEAIRTGDYKVYYPENNGREGLFINIQAQFLRALLPLNNNQPEPWMLRLPSAIFGILTVLGLYFLAKELFEKKTALLASFFLATSVWHLIFSRIGFRAIMAPMLLIWALYFLLLGFRKTSPSAKTPLPSTFYFLLSGVIFGLGFYTYIAYRIMALLVFFVLWHYWRTSRKEGWQKVFLYSTSYFLLSTFFIALPIGIYYLQNPQDFFGRTAQISIFSSPTPLKDLGINIIKTLGMFNFVGDGNWRHNYAGNPQLFWPVGIMFLIGAYIALKNIIRSLKIRNRNEDSELEDNPHIADTKTLHFSFCILILWFGLAMLPVVISSEGLPHALRAILMIPPVFVFAGFGGIWIYDYLRAKWTVAAGSRKTMLRIACYAFLALLVTHSYRMYFLDWARRPETQGAFSANYVMLGRALNALPKETPKYVLVEAGGTLVNGIPMPTQTTMFITDTYTQEGQRAKNIHYVLPENESTIPADSLVFVLE